LRQSNDPSIATALIFIVVRNTSVSNSIRLDDTPKLSTTRWRVVADQRDRLFHVESAISANVFCVDVDLIGLSEDVPVLA
jgi:penicillin V acylase-like amidase (Ntn superfamily)